MVRLRVQAIKQGLQCSRQSSTSHRSKGKAKDSAALVALSHLSRRPALRVQQPPAGDAALAVRQAVVCDDAVLCNCVCGCGQWCVRCERCVWTCVSGHPQVSSADQPASQTSVEWQLLEGTSQLARPHPSSPKSRRWPQLLAVKPRPVYLGWENVRCLWVGHTPKHPEFHSHKSTVTRSSTHAGKRTSPESSMVQHLPQTVQWKLRPLSSAAASSSKSTGGAPLLSLLLGILLASVDTRGRCMDSRGSGGGGAPGGRVCKAAAAACRGAAVGRRRAAAAISVLHPACRLMPRCCCIVSQFYQCDLPFFRFATVLSLAGSLVLTGV
jgi:hypothetical protein